MMFYFNQEETKVVTIDGYEDMSESDSALLCATIQQPISVGIDGSAMDFQLYLNVVSFNVFCYALLGDPLHSFLKYPYVYMIYFLIC
ncbi:hypothetical protein I3842_15G067700 [Carya illinoinensis]|uniref:Uncharacterized protein n=1 Tax=Carya illinoinensis TaxID=32201 RepID=A0A922A4V0_CARIL|nr:hypothetical protein I3842_15G067700 [Carya illinoinensis]